MKIQINKDAVRPEPKLPYLVQSKNHDRIVLKTAENGRGLFTGVLLGGFESNSNKIGETSDTWIENCFEYFEGSVTLTND